jgi:acetoin utilization protein AcuB
MQIQDVMTRRVETIGATDDVRAALERMRMKRIRHLVVLKDGKVAGIVSDGDMRALSPIVDRTVEEVMSAPAVAAAPNMTIRQAANLLRGRSIGCLPVLDDGKLVGILTTTDLLERLGRGDERPVGRGKRWILKGRGPRRKGVVGRKGFASH